MRRVVCVALLVCTSTMIASQEVEPRALYNRLTGADQTEKVSGHIARIVIERERYRGCLWGSGRGTGEAVEEIGYDDKERMTEHIFYDSDGKVNNRILYKYSDRGQVIEVRNEYADRNLSGKDQNFYDEQGNLQEVKMQDLDGRQTGQIRYVRNGPNEEITTYVNGVGVPYQREVLTYDEQSRCLRLKSYEGSQQILRQERVLCLDSQLRLLEDQTFAGTERRIASKCRYEYDKEGLVRKISSYDGGGRLLSEQWCTYDKCGRLAEVLQKDNATGKQAKQVTEYDGAGNWIRRSRYRLRQLFIFKYYVLVEKVQRKIEPRT